ncbi:hypothetical protein SADUNF_Sadunf16G0021300 [Salix dunnii]|uniref:NAD-dependent epimerase/dehydratase domain-containing protein n=1 Tax=Salix dunnii TaxID=1413687 RepID=A0A835MFF3_9ROSI|nr:hypothetical protein SADUNF_Sadunf16G0021300 [Salix dunnii]
MLFLLDISVPLGMDYLDSRRKSSCAGKIIAASLCITACIIILKQSQSPSYSNLSSFSQHELGVTHVLVTGGAGYIGSHAALRLLNDSYLVTIVDNLSRGNLGAVKVLQDLFPEPGRYYHNITSNTLVVLEAMAAHKVKTLIYSSTRATYGEPVKMPITEKLLSSDGSISLPINPYGKAKKMAEDIIIDFSKTTDMAVMILRYFNVIVSDPEGKLGEAPQPDLREHGRISGACFDAAKGIIPGLKVKGIDCKTADGTCVRDYIDVTDLVDAHAKALAHAKPRKVGIYNVGTGKGRSVKEFVEASKKATGVDIKVEYLGRRPGDLC